MTKRLLLLMLLCISTLGNAQNITVQGGTHCSMYMSLGMIFKNGEKIEVSVPCIATTKKKRLIKKDIDLNKNNKEAITRFILINPNAAPNPHEFDDLVMVANKLIGPGKPDIVIYCEYKEYRENKILKLVLSQKGVKPNVTINRKKRDKGITTATDNETFYFWKKETNYRKNEWKTTFTEWESI